MASKYSKLSIDIHKIPDWIKFWCEENLVGQIDIQKKENSQRIDFTITGAGVPIKIGFLFCKGGLITIQPHMGSNIPASEKIAEYILSKAGNVLKDSPFANGYSILIKKSNFDTLIDLISDMDGVVLNNYSEQKDPGVAQYLLYRYTGPAGDTITIKYYTHTSRMQMQGKPLALFSEVLSMVCESETSPEAIVDANIKYCSLSITQQEMQEELEGLLGSELCNFLSKTQKLLLSTSLTLSKVDVELGDYSAIVFPSLRAVEGFIKKVYNQFGLQDTGNGQINQFFDFPQKDQPEMKDIYASKLDAEQANYLTGMYKFYRKNRHPYGHASNNDVATSIISSRDKADLLIQDIFENMKAWYDWYIKNK